MTKLEGPLAPFQGKDTRSDLEEAVEQAHTKMGLTADFLTVDDTEILLQDRAQIARLTYVVSYLRLVNFLRDAPSGERPEEMAARQAATAFRYIQHAENTNLKVLQFGRDVQDQELVKAIQELRGELEQVAQSKANMKQRQAVIAEVLPKEPTNGEKGK